MKRRTKVVCTIGPATSTPERVRALIQAGMNVVRLNMSHGDHAIHRERYALVRRCAAELDANVAIMIDLQGPKIRTGKLKDGQLVELVDGAEFVITTDGILGDVNRVSTSYKHLPLDVKTGDRILMADGSLELRVCSVHGSNVICEVVRGGMLGEHKGINLPGVEIAEPSLTAKDFEDLAFGLDLGVDFVALSFVRHPNDIVRARQFMQERGKSAAIIAKIERPEALARFDEILPLCDAIMVARGDLGVEVDFEEVPVIQKRLIHRCNEAGTPVITATQMLESMITHAQPTRAEVTDVANAIFDGTDAVMLSAETAAGQFPIEACATMSKIAFKADTELASGPSSERFVRLRAVDLERHRLTNAAERMGNEFALAIGQAVCRMVSSLDVKRIVCFTTSGYTASTIARFRPAVRIAAITNTASTQRRLALMWGVNAFLVEDFDLIDHMVARVDRLLIENNLAQLGDTVIIVAGTPLVVGGRTNLLKLHTVGEVER